MALPLHTPTSPSAFQLTNHQLQLPSSAMCFNQRLAKQLTSPSGCSKKRTRLSSMQLGISCPDGCQHCSLSQNGKLSNKRRLRARHRQCQHQNQEILGWLVCISCFKPLGTSKGLQATSKSAVKTTQERQPIITIALDLLHRGPYQYQKNFRSP